MGKHRQRSYILFF